MHPPEYSPNSEVESRQAWLRYSAAIAATLLAAGLRLLCDPWLGERQPFVFFYTAIAFAGWFGGWGPATTSLALGYLLGDFLFVAPRYELLIKIRTSEAAAPSLAYTIVGLTLVAVTHSLHMARRRAWQTAAAYQQFAAMVEHAADAIIRKDLQGRILEWNPGAEDLFGYSSREAVGQPSDIIVPEDRRAEEAAFTESIRRGQPIRNVETLGRDKQGRRLHIAITQSPIRDPQGRVIGQVAVAHDIRRLKEVEQELQEGKAALELKVAERTERLEQIVAELQRADRLKSEFLATMSHELRTPLNSIIGFTEMVKEEMSGPLNDVQKTQLGVAHASARHLLGLISDLLDLSRIEAGRTELQPEWFNAPALFTELVRTVEPLAQRKKMEVKKEIDLPMKLHADRKKLFQVILNLLSNAVKFTDKGEVWLSAKVRDGCLQVAVQDTGVGIREQDVEHLFEAFRQVEGSTKKRYEGTGLGLYLSRKLVELMGGEIGVESAFGTGSKFHFSVPVRQASEVIA